MSAKDTLPLEKDFQTYCLKKLRSIGPSVYAEKINDRTLIGFPDLLICVAGCFVIWELKTRSKLAPIQAYTLKKIDRAGGHTFVVTPDTFDEAFAFVRKLALLNPRKDIS